MQLFDMPWFRVIVRCEYLVMPFEGGAITGAYATRDIMAESSEVAVERAEELVRSEFSAYEGDFSRLVVKAEEFARLASWLPFRKQVRGFTFWQGDDDPKG